MSSFLLYVLQCSFTLAITLSLAMYPALLFVVFVSRRRQIAAPVRRAAFGPGKKQKAAIFSAIADDRRVP